MTDKQNEEASAVHVRDAISFLSHEEHCETAKEIGALSSVLQQMLSLNNVRDSSRKHDFLLEFLGQVSPESQYFEKSILHCSKGGFETGSKGNDTASSCR